MGYNSLLKLFSLILKLYQIWPMRAPSVWLLSFWLVLIILFYFKVYSRIKNKTNKEKETWKRLIHSCDLFCFAEDPLCSTLQPIFCFPSTASTSYMRIWVLDGKQWSNNQSFRGRVTEDWVFAMLPISLWPHESYLGCPAGDFLNLNKNNIMIAFMKVK